MRISDGSSDVCSSDLDEAAATVEVLVAASHERLEAHLLDVKVAYLRVVNRDLRPGGVAAEQVDLPHPDPAVAPTLLENARPVDGESAGQLASKRHAVAIAVNVGSPGQVARGVENLLRSEEGRVEKECVSTCSSRWSQYN